ncbi:Glucose-1-phosphate adenylyltransferase [Candidatus Omnitrophus magneticus]|uniref:Glucose-1-phosphate adenylyltransferase n=1 Tax=Candidatus Omnitrophus magneticus TaxID=1609969 RepID=A0A0F0CLU1_9BACT|nr:Glucose-1-phosphate adenylyltransferase [Candidatus Omnitrophus magneticus]
MDPLKEVLCVVLGGGRGTRLYPLTKERCKPAVPLFGKHRLIDIPISNCLNADLRKIYILTQFNSESLNKHVSRTYKMESFSKGFVEIMAAEQSMDNTNWFQGTADAVRRCLKHFNDPYIKYVLILSGDQLYRLNLKDVIYYHLEKHAEVTVACNRVSPEETAGFGIMSIDKNSRIVNFVEKPKDISLISKMAITDNGKTSFLGSMGIYMFNKQVLIELLAKNYQIDFGKEVIPEAINVRDTYAYVFDGYWRDIGTIKTFYDENLRFAEQIPPLNMYDETWQIFTKPRYLPPARIENCQIERSIIAEGSKIFASKITHSIIGIRFIVGKGTTIKETITMGCDYYETDQQVEENHMKGIPCLGVGANCHIEKAILDKNVRIGDNVKILNEKNIQNHDGPNYFIRDGIVVINKNTVIPSGTVI